MKKLICMISLIFTLSTLSAETIHLIVPYAGAIKNSLKIESAQLNLSDQSLMEGIYIQQIRPQRYQWNTFIYYADDINSSSILGTHAILDYYFKIGKIESLTAGIGLDILKINTELNQKQSYQPSGMPMPVTIDVNTQMKNNICAPYLRFGKYFHYRSGLYKHSSFTWFGYEQDIIQGDLSFDVPNIENMPPITILDQKIDQKNHYGLLGFTYRLRVHHFIDIKCKYHFKKDLNQNKFYHNFSNMTNIYLTKHFGLSYRFRSMEETIGKNNYHMGGIIFIF